MKVPKLNDIMPIRWTPDKFKEVREALGLTQKQLGTLLDVSSPTISYLERGKVVSPLILLGYGVVLEHLYAYYSGYVPAYRKVGESTFEDPFESFHDEVTGVKFNADGFRLSGDDVIRQVEKMNRDRYERGLPPI